MSFHKHDWRHVRHVLRCADADCGAWTPAPLSAAQSAPIEPPARRRKPKPAPTAAKRTKRAAPAAAGSNVVPLSHKRKG